MQALSVEAGLAKAQARLSLGLDAKALLAAVPQHLAFLRAAHRAGVSLRAPSAKTLERYASKWLPLLATADEGAALAPPPDVAWAWHCHRLAPQSYARTARRLGLPETKPFLIQAEGATQNATQKAWAAAYPDEPFFLEGDSGDDAGALVLDGFDVAAAAERQRTFLWQVSGPRFDEGYFLCDGARRYENFLRLMRSGEFLVPTYQIDLFWHTHILASASTYAADTRRLCGFELPHDDSVNDRAEGSKLNRQYEVTQRLWAEAYGERYAVPGGMYRGEPPEAYFEPTWEKETVEIRWRLLREAGVTWQPGGAPPVAEGVVVGTSYVVPRVWSVEGDALASGLHQWIAYQPHDVATLEAAYASKGRVSLGLYDVDLDKMQQTRRETGVVRRVHVSSMPWWIYGANVRLDAAANTVVNEAYASGQGTATLPDGSVADLHGFSLTRTTGFEHRDPGGGWTPYDAQCTAAIAAAMGNCPAGGAVNLPGGIPFEVRWGTQATSAKMPTPPPEGMIQVNTANQNTRVVRRAAGGSVPFSKAPDFIAGAPKSTTTANANPQREGHALCGNQPVCRVHPIIIH